MEITDEVQYAEIKSKVHAYDAEVHRRFPRACSYDPKSITCPHASNEERSAVETWEFQHTRSDKAFAYVDLPGRRVTTWTGQTLGTITGMGRRWRDGFGGKRIPIDVTGINGVRYHGTYYASAGDYARLTAKRRKGSLVTA